MAKMLTDLSIAQQYIVFHRVQPTTQKGYILVAHTAFQKGSKDRGWSEHVFKVSSK